MARTSRRPTVVDPTPRYLVDDAEHFPPAPVNDDDIDFLTEAAEGEGTWYVERFKSAGEMRDNPRGQPLVFVTKIPAPLDLAAFHSEFGGGVYRFKRKLPDGTFSGSKIRELDGPTRARLFDPAPAAAPPPVVQPAAPAIDPVLALLTRMDERLSRLEATPATPPPPTSMKELAETMVMLQGLTKGAGPADPSQEIVHTYFAIMQKGIELGQGREPALEPAGTDWGKVLESALPLLDRMITQRQQRRVVMRPSGQAVPPGSATPPGPASGSSAEVLDPPTPVVSAQARRWGAAVEALAGAVQQQTDPALFADALGVILLPLELAELAGHSADEIVAELAGAREAFPVLGEAATRAYLERVLAELNRPPGDDDPDDSPESE